MFSSKIGSYEKSKKKLYYERPSDKIETLNPSYNQLKAKAKLRKKSPGSIFSHFSWGMKSNSKKDLMSVNKILDNSV